MLVGVLVGSDYLHTLNLVSLVGVSLVRALLACPGWKWLPACLEPRVLAGWCVPGSCWFVSLVGSSYLHALNLVPCWFVFALCFAGNFFRPRKARALLVRVLVGSGYLHALNLVSLVGVSLVRAGWCAGWK